MLPDKRPAYSRTRKRRVRKKLYLDEFQVLGFNVKFCMHPSITSMEVDQLFDAFIEQAEGRNLMCGGGGGAGGMGFFIYGENDRSATIEDRCAVNAFLNTQPKVVQVWTSDFKDVYYRDE